MHGTGGIVHVLKLRNLGTDAYHEIAAWDNGLNPGGSASPD